MFALEIIFHDAVSESETLLVRRPQMIVGSSDYAQVEIDDMRDLGFQLRFVRDLGNRFHCVPLPMHDGVEIPANIGGMYDGSASITLGNVRLYVTALDSDLMVKEGEPPDRAGVRVLRSSALERSPVFPAVVILGATPVSISFNPSQPVYIGRSKQCAVRLDSPEISGRHARFGYEGGEFWIEDLGSTNGTFVNQQQISGRANVPAGVPIVLGRDISLCGVTSEDQIGSMQRAPQSQPPKAQKKEAAYPVLVSVSEVARPARLMLTAGNHVVLGRDPASDVWLGAPHVSRRHCEVLFDGNGLVSVMDESTNGTAYDGGLLRKGDVLEVRSIPHVFDFGGGVTVALCFDRDQEEAFVASQGALTVFAQARDGSAMEPRSTTLHGTAGENVALPENAEMAFDEAVGGSRFTRFRDLYRSHGLVSRLVGWFAVIGVVVVMVVVIAAIVFKVDLSSIHQ